MRRGDWIAVKLALDASPNESANRSFIGQVEALELLLAEGAMKTRKSNVNGTYGISRNRPRDTVVADCQR